MQRQAQRITIWLASMVIICFSSLIPFRATAQELSSHAGEVSASDYCEFLNATAASDPQNLFDGKMENDLAGACITRAGVMGNFSYQLIAGKEDEPMTFMSAEDAALYCNWKGCSADFLSADFNIDACLKSNVLSFSFIDSSTTSASEQSSQDGSWTRDLEIGAGLVAFIAAIAIYRPCSAQDINASEGDNNENRELPSIHPVFSTVAVKSNGPPVGVIYTKHDRLLISPTTLGDELSATGQKRPPFARENSSLSDYGELTDWNDEGDIVTKVITALAEEKISEATGRTPFLESMSLHSYATPIKVKLDQRVPSARHLSTQASNRSLLNSSSAATELAAVRSAPLAEFYRGLSLDQQNILNNDKILVVETKGESYKSYGMTYFKLSTMTACYLLDADEKTVADLYWDPVQATKILPYCSEVSDLVSTPSSQSAGYIFKGSATIPMVGEVAAKEVIPFRNQRTQFESGGVKISFTQTTETKYIKKFEGAFTVVPHGEKLLATYEVSPDLKGQAATFVTNDVVRNGAYGVMLNIINPKNVNRKFYSADISADFLGRSA